MKRGVTKSIVTHQNLIRSKQRKGKLKKSVKIRNKKPRENRLILTGFWSRRRDLNPRPSRPERDALPAALRLDFLSLLRISRPTNALIIADVF